MVLYEYISFQSISYFYKYSMYHEQLLIKQRFCRSTFDAISFLSLSLSIWTLYVSAKGVRDAISLCSIISSCRIHGELTVAGGSRHDDNNRETSRCRVQRDESRGIETFPFANYLYVFQLDSANVMVFEFRQKSTIEWSRKMENFIIFFIRLLLHIDNSWSTTVISIERYIYIRFNANFSNFYQCIQEWSIEMIKDKNIILKSIDNQ